MAKTNILSALEVSGQIPLDAKLYFTTLAELKDLGDNNIKAFKYYELMPVTCVEDKQKYVWREKVNANDVGILDEDFTYPANAVSFGINYSERVFNFFKESSNGNKSDVIFVTKDNLSGKGDLEDQIVEYTNSLSYDKEDDIADLWIEYNGENKADTSFKIEVTVYTKLNDYVS